jgi:hypothetical protein
MARRQANLVFVDPPYNVAVDGNVSGNGAIKHLDFVMAAGELNEAEFVAFLTTSLRLLARYSKSYRGERSKASPNSACQFMPDRGDRMHAAGNRQMCAANLVNLAIRWLTSVKHSKAQRGPGGGHSENDLSIR